MREFKQELFEKSIYLRNLDLDKVNYDKAREIQKEQDKYYKEWLFMEKLDKELNKNEKIIKSNMSKH